MAACILNPIAAQAHHNGDRHRAECLFSFGLAKESCKRGFDGSTYAQVNKEVVNKFFDDFRTAFRRKDVKLLAIDTAIPDQVWFNFDFSGTGLLVGYETQDKVDQIKDKAKKKQIDLYEDLMPELVPDIIRITVGFNLALVLTVTMGTILVYNTEASVLKIWKMIEGNR